MCIVQYSGRRGHRLSTSPVSFEVIQVMPLIYSFIIYQNGYHSLCYKQLPFNRFNAVQTDLMLCSSSGTKEFYKNDGKTMQTYKTHTHQVRYYCYVTWLRSNDQSTRLLMSSS